MFKEQNDLIDTDTEFIIRDRNNLDDFLYELNGAYLKRDGAKNFDTIDMIFVSGEANMRPWSQKAIKILLLLRMCLTVKKILFTCSFGFQALIFLSATNFEKHYNVINGSGNCSTISDLLNNQIEDPKNLNVNDIFVDNVTGDVYSYNHEGQKWTAVCNTGIHYTRAAHEYQTLGKYILKAPQFKQNKPLDEQIYLNSTDEIIINIRKRYIQHWLLQGINHTFKVSQKNKWDGHSFSSINPEKQFIILAESDKGPSIIEFDHIVATQFDINEKFPMSVLIFKNFLLNFSNKYKSQKLNIKSIAETQPSYTPAEQLLHDKIQQKKSKFLKREMDIRIFSNKLVKNSVQIQEEKYKFKHAGMAANKKHNINSVENNAIQTNFEINQHPKTLNSPHLKIRKLNWVNPSTPSETLLTQQDEIQNSQMQSSNQQKINSHILSSKQIRQILHPSLQIEKMHDHVWIPGQLSKNPSQNAIKVQDTSSYLNRSLRAKKELTKSVTNDSVFFKRPYQQLVDRKSNIFSEDPYMSQEEIERKYQAVFFINYYINQQEKDQQIIAHRVYKFGNKNDFFQKDTSHFANMDPININKNKQVFREINRKKWINQSDFNIVF